MLNHFRTVAFLALAGCVVGVAAASAQENASNSSVRAGELEKEFRAAADSFVEAFKKRDAADIAAHWTQDGVYTNENGVRFVGREAIQTEYEALFAEAPQNLEMRIEVDSVRLLNPQTALEEGRAALVPQPPGESRVMSRYTAIHVKQAGKWLMADVRDTRVELPAHLGNLQDLATILGSWKAVDEDRQVNVTCRWTPNERFILQTSTAAKASKVVSGALEIIGVDPSTGRITSWTFTYDGGHAMATWAPHENGWTLQSVGVTGEGMETTAVNILSRKDDNALTWKSVKRTVGDALLPDTSEIVLQR